jgi:type II secretory pathway component PulK
MLHDQDTPPCKDDSGFALVTVLWIVGLLAVMTASLAVSVNTHVRVIANVTESAKAEALADAGVALAVVDLMAAHLSPDHRRRFPLDGQAVGCSVAGEGALSIAISDEAGKIDLNTAGVPLMRALLTGLGVSVEKSAQAADAIFDFRDADDDRRPNGAESAEYRAAGLGWLPKNGGLQSLDELTQVYGFNADLAARMRPYISVYTGLEGFDASIASPKLIAVLRAGMARSGGSLGGLADLNDAVSLPAIFIAASSRKIFGLRVEARSAAGAVFVREAVLNIGSWQSAEHNFLRWSHGTSVTSELKDHRRVRVEPGC